MQVGNTLLTLVGRLSIQSVNQAVSEQISIAEANRAAYISKDVLLDEIRARTEGEVCRVELELLRPDPRIALRMTEVVTEAETQDLQNRLSRLDSRAPNGAWTSRTLEVLKNHPGIRAGDICELVGQDKEHFKIDVRKLKNLGLTESLATGFRLAPHGETLLRILSALAGKR